jgi:hypothetical protein
LRRRQCQEPANFELPKEIEWEKIFNKGLDFEAMVSKPSEDGAAEEEIRVSTCSMLTANGGQYFA